MLKRLIGYLTYNIWFKVDVRIFGLPIHVSPPHIWWYLLRHPNERIWSINLEGGRRGVRFLGLIIGMRDKMDEAEIIINGSFIPRTQSMTIRVALESLAASLEDGLGGDEHGRHMTDLYFLAIDGIRASLYRE